MDLDLDLDYMTETMESLMVDEVTIHRDPQLTEDDAWDDDTGTYTRPLGDDKLVYSGRAYIAPQQTFPREEIVGGQETFLTWHWLSLPLGNGYEPHPEDLVTVAAVGRKKNLSMVGRQFLVDTSEDSTFSVSQRVRIHRRRGRP